MVACRLLLASAEFSVLRSWIWPKPVPNVIFVAVPLPTAATSRTVPTARFEVAVRARLVVARPVPIPSAASRLLPGLLELMLRSDVVPVETTSCPEPLTEAAVAPAAVVKVACPAVGPEVESVAVLTPVARSIAFSKSPTLPDPMNTVELPEPSVTTLPETPEGGLVGGGGERGGRRSRAGLEGDGVAVNCQRVAVTDGRGDAVGVGRFRQ